MVRKKNRIVAGAGVLLVVLGIVFMSGCTDMKSYYGSNCRIEGTGVILSVNRTSDPLNMWINGDFIQVTVHRNVEISNINVKGNHSFVQVSRFHGNNTIMDSKITGSWMYYDD